MNGSVLTATASTVSQPAAARTVAQAPRSGLRDATVIFVVWTVVALLSAGFSTLNRIHANQPPEWERALALSLLAFELCVPSTFVLLQAVRRWPLGAGRWRHVALYLAAIPVLVVIKYAIYIPVRRWLFPSPPVQITEHLIEAFFYEAFMLSILFNSRSSTNGPFFADLDTYRFSFPRRRPRTINLSDSLCLRRVRLPSVGTPQGVTG